MAAEVNSRDINLYSHITFDEGTGFNARDRVTNTNGNVVSSAWLSGGQGYYIQGVGDASGVNMGRSSNYDLVGDFVIYCDIPFFPQEGQWYVAYYRYANFPGYALYIRADGYIYFEFAVNYSNYVDIISSYQLRPGKSYRIVVYRRENKLGMTINGINEPEVTVTQNDIVTSSNDLCIAGNVTQYGGCGVDEFAIWRKSVSSNIGRQIEQLRFNGHAQ